MRKKNETYSADEVLIEETSKKPKKRSWFSKKPKEEEFNVGDDVYYGIEKKSFTDHTKAYEFTGEISLEDGKFERLFDTSAVSINKEEKENFDRIAKERKRRVATAAQTAGVDVKDVENEFGVAAPMPVTSLAADPYTKTHGIAAPKQSENNNYQQAMMHTAELEKMQLQLNVLNDTVEVKKDKVVPQVDAQSLNNLKNNTNNTSNTKVASPTPNANVTTEQQLMQSQDTIATKIVSAQVYDDMPKVKPTSIITDTKNATPTNTAKPVNHSGNRNEISSFSSQPRPKNVENSANTQARPINQPTAQTAQPTAQTAQPTAQTAQPTAQAAQPNMHSTREVEDDFENLDSNSSKSVSNNNPIEVEKAKFIANFQKTGEVHKPITPPDQNTMYDLKIPTQTDGEIPTVEDIRDYRDKTLPLHIINIDILQSVIAKECESFAKATSANATTQVVTIPKTFKTKEPELAPPPLEQEIVQDTKVSKVKKDVDTQHILNSRLSSATIGMFVSGVLLIVMFFSNIILSGLLNDENTLKNQLTPHLVIALVSLLTLLLINHKNLIKGFVKLIKFAPNGDSALSLAFLGALLQNVTAFTFSDVMLSRSTGLYAIVVVFALFLNYIGKLLMLRRVSSNYKFVKSKEQKYSIKIYEDYNNSLKFANDIVTGAPTIAYQKKTADSKNFWELSTKADPVVTSGRGLVPVSFLVSLVVCLISMFIYKNIYMGINVFTACVCSSLAIGNMISSNVPLSRMCRKTRKSGAMLAGYMSVSKFANVNTIMIDASEFFPTGTVVLDGIKTYGGGDKEQDMNFAAALLAQLGGTLGDVINQIINDKDDDLPKVTNMAFEEEHGVVASVEGRKVLVGDKNLLMNHQIELPPSQDINEFKAGGKKLIYISIDSKLRFIFILSYKADRRKKNEIKKLEAAGISVIARSKDPNITQKFISKLFAISPYSINIITDSLGEAYDDLVSRESKKVDAFALTKGRVESIMTVISECVTHRKTISVIVAIQCIGSIIALLCAMLFAFSAAISGLSAAMIIIYQIIWLVASLIITKLKKV